MRYIVIALLFICFACNRSSDQQNIKDFVIQWSKRVESKDLEGARKFYDGSFVLPKAMFDVPDGISFTLNMEAIQIESGGGDSLHVSVPYHITTISGLEETNTMTLSIFRNGDARYSIFDMSPELVLKIKEFALVLEQRNVPPEVARGDSLLLASISYLQTKYDTVAYYGKLENVTLFYVANGNWNDPYPYEAAKQRNRGDYKIGVVTGENNIIIPVEFDKIYNPNGSFAGMIEVEKDGRRGLYTVEGKVFLAPEYEGIFPVIIPEVFAQVKRDGQYGWVTNAGITNFDVTSNPNKDLFKSPLTGKLVSDWNFIYPGEVTVLYPPPVDDYVQGLIIYPSYLSDVGITPIANRGVAVSDSEWGMGMEENTIRIEKAESVSDKFYALVSFFMESGTDARGYHTEKNEVVVVNNEGSVVSMLPQLTIDEYSQNPCDTKNVYRSIEPGFYETMTGDGTFRYFKVNLEGEIEELTTYRQYSFTKYVRIDEHYFHRCNWQDIPWESRKEDDIYNVIVTNGLSYEDLDVMRNEIFAEYGFIFKSEKWKKYFSDKPWYQPQYENVDHLMNEIDKYNVKFIRDYQQNHKDMNVQRDSIQVMWAG